MTPLNCSNIYHDSAVPSEGERFKRLLKKNNVEILRIISSPKIDQEVMCQKSDEWFIMIEGSATIMIGDMRRELIKGDYCFIEAKQVHQVLRVEEGSVWLAVHIG